MLLLKVSKHRFVRERITPCTNIVQKEPYKRDDAKETYNFKEPTNCSHPIVWRRTYSLQRRRHSLLVTGWCARGSRPVRILYTIQVLFRCADKASWRCDIRCQNTSSCARGSHFVQIWHTIQLLFGCADTASWRCDIRCQSTSSCARGSRPVPIWHKIQLWLRCADKASWRCDIRCHNNSLRARGSRPVPIWHTTQLLIRCADKASWRCDTKVSRHRYVRKKITPCTNIVNVNYVMKGSSHRFVCKKIMAWHTHEWVMAHRYMSHGTQDLCVQYSYTKRLVRCARW